MTGSERPAPAGVVDHLFRHSAGHIVATLARALGPARLDLAEEAMQDALVQALRTWPQTGVPDNPQGWLYRAARNRAIDLLRSDDVLRAKLPLLAEPPKRLNPSDAARSDDELALMFLCCHPELVESSRVALTLKVVGGLGVDEIASALLASRTSIAQRLVRAKRWLRASGVPLDVPEPEALPSRLDSVLAVLYLLFNAGYEATAGDAAIRGELCAEAIRLGRLLLADRRTDLPRVRALVALMLLQASRLPARTDDDGDVLLLAEQDRTRWDHVMIVEGARLLEAACAGPDRSGYHVEAAIAACHAAARSPEETDWPRIVALYDQLLALRPSPVARLNRAIAVGMAEGPARGIAELEPLEDHPRLREYLLLPAALGALWLRADEPARAAEYYRRCTELPCSAPQRRFLERKLAECGLTP